MNPIGFCDVAGRSGVVYFSRNSSHLSYAHTMRYTLEHFDNSATLVLHEDRLDDSVSAEFKSELLLHSRSGIEVLFVDLSEVEFCDSAGLSAMLFAHREMRAASGATIFVGLSERLMSFVALSQLDNVLFIYETREEALADLEGDDE